MMLAGGAGESRKASGEQACALGEQGRERVWGKRKSAHYCAKPSLPKGMLTTTGLAPGSVRADSW